MKKFLSLILALAMSMSLVACGGGDNKTNDGGNTGDENTVKTTVEVPAALDPNDFLTGNYTALPADGPSVSLTIGHAMQESTESHKMLVHLKDALEKYSDGKISVTIYPNSQLGNDAEMIASCIAGDIDIVFQSGATHSTFVPETVLFDIPFLFSGYDEETVESVLTDSEFRDLYNAANEKAGLVCLLLRAGVEGMNLTANKPINSLADLKGLKIRTAQVESRMEVWKVLGANPTPMAFSELYMALQNGTVDSQDNTLSNAINSALYEVQEYLIPTNHMTPSMDLTMNKATFDALPAEYQALIREICTDMTAYDFETTRNMEQYYYDCLTIEHGMTACEISDEFQAAMKENSAPAVESALKTINNDALYDALIAALNA